MAKMRRFFLHKYFSKSLFCGAGIGSCFMAEGAGFNQAGAGGAVGIFYPTYGEFKTLSESNSQPPLPTTMLMTGGEAMFARKNIIYGGRVLSGSSKTSSGTKGSVYDLNYAGFFAGYGFSFGAVNLSVTNLLGLGNIAYSWVNDSSGSAITLSYLAVEPAAQVGFVLSPNFKLGVGGTYQLGFLHRVDQYGVEKLTDPGTQVKMGGIMYLLTFSFGSFGGGSGG